MLNYVIDTRDKSFASMQSMLNGMLDECRAEKRKCSQASRFVFDPPKSYTEYIFQFADRVVGSESDVKATPPTFTSGDLRVVTSVDGASGGDSQAGAGAVGTVDFLGGSPTGWSFPEGGPTGRQYFVDINRRHDMITSGAIKWRFYVDKPIAETLYFYLRLPFIVNRDASGQLIDLTIPDAIEIGSYTFTASDTPFQSIEFNTTIIDDITRYTNEDTLSIGAYAVSGLKRLGESFADGNRKAESGILALNAYTPAELKRAAVNNVNASWDTIKVVFETDGVPPRVEGPPLPTPPPGGTLVTVYNQPGFGDNPIPGNNSYSVFATREAAEAQFEFVDWYRSGLPQVQFVPAKTRGAVRINPAAAISTPALINATINKDGTVTVLTQFRTTDANGVIQNVGTTLTTFADSATALSVNEALAHYATAIVTITEA